MNIEREIMEAVADYQAGRLGEIARSGGEAENR